MVHARRARGWSSHVPLARSTSTPRWHVTPQCPAAHSWLIVSLYMRALFYFRGSLQFGALMYMVIDVFKSVIPFLLLLLVVTFGFSFGIALLIQHTTYRARGKPRGASRFGESWPRWHSFSARRT